MLIGAELRIPSVALEPVLAPVRLRNASETIADRLITAIALGFYVPGQRLPTERELAEMLKVSRATVHDALQQIAGSGHVEIRRGRNGGAYVISGWSTGSAEVVERTLAASWKSLEALFDIRQFIEPSIAAAAAERRTDGDLKVIHDAFEAYAGAGDDREASRIADQRLHSAIAQATRNPYLVSLSVQVRDQISLGFDAEPYTPSVRKRALKQHAALVAAVTDGQPHPAAQTAREHFALTESTIRSLFLRAQTSDGSQCGATADAPGETETYPR